VNHRWQEDAFDVVTSTHRFSAAGSSWSGAEFRSQPMWSSLPHCAPHLDVVLEISKGLAVETKRSKHIFTSTYWQPNLTPEVWLLF